MAYINSSFWVLQDKGLNLKNSSGTSISHHHNHDSFVELSRNIPLSVARTSAAVPFFSFWYDLDILKFTQLFDLPYLIWNDGPFQILTWYLLPSFQLLEACFILNKTRITASVFAHGLDSWVWSVISMLQSKLIPFTKAN